MSNLLMNIVSYYFNSSKSVLLIFCDKGSSYNYKLKLHGSDLELKEQACYFGILISEQNSSDNVKKAVTDLCNSTNLLLTNLGHIPVNILTRLFWSFCTSFHQSSLWKLSELNLFPLEVVWWKCIKRIWKHKALTRPMCQPSGPNRPLSNVIVSFLDFCHSCVMG